jgi:hypothetical protein
MLAARLLRKPAGTEMEDQMDAAGLRIGKLTNAVLSAVMSVERRLIRIGLRLPFGGSLLVIAKAHRGRNPNGVRNVNAEATTHFHCRARIGPRTASTNFIAVWYRRWNNLAEFRDCAGGGLRRRQVVGGH